MTNRFSNRIGGALAIAAVLGLISVPAVAANVAGNPSKTSGNFDNPAVMPVNSNPLGLSYGEWSARFWQWQFSLPVDANPIFDTADCSKGQTGKVWFLGGSSVSFEIAPGVLLAKEHRNCNVPPGTFLFFPIVNNECSTVPEDVLPISGGFSTPPTPAELLTCARFASSFIVRSTLRATLDGVPIKALTQYEVTSPLFTFGPMPDKNVLQSFGLFAPAGTLAHSVSDGIHLMLHPLSPGIHVLHFYAELDLGPIGGPKFIQDITYSLR